jgi:hypothetical protein
VSQFSPSQRTKLSPTLSHPRGTRILVNPP